MAASTSASLWRASANVSATRFAHHDLTVDVHDEHPLRDGVEGLD
jgi:hypothetical protein